MPRVIAFGDLHLGNIMSDTIAFRQLLDKALAEKPDCIVFLGDVIDGAFKYPTQMYRIPNIRPIDIQRVMFKDFILDYIEKKCGKKSPLLVFIKGNHDVNFIENFLKPAFSDVKLPYKYVYQFKIDNTLFMHYITRRSRGSYATTLTPQLVSMCMSIMLKEGVKRLVFGHLHRSVVFTRIASGEIIVLPPFIRRDDAYDNMYDFCIAIIDTDKNKVSFVCQEPTADLAEVQVYNTELRHRAEVKLIREEGGLRPF